MEPVGWEEDGDAEEEEGEEDPGKEGSRMKGRLGGDSPQPTDASTSRQSSVLSDESGTRTDGTQFGNVNGILGIHHLKFYQYGTGNRAILRNDQI